MLICLALSSLLYMLQVFGFCHPWSCSQLWTRQHVRAVATAHRETLMFLSTLAGQLCSLESTAGQTVGICVLMDSTHLAKSCLISASYGESIWIPATSQPQYMKHPGCWMEMLDQELDCIPNAGSSDLIVLFNV